MVLSGIEEKLLVRLAEGLKVDELDQR